MNRVPPVESRMIKVKVGYVSLTRDLSKSKEEELQLPEPAHANDAVSKAVEIHPRLSTIRQSLRVAVNGSITDENPELRDGDTVVLLPAVAGG